MLHDRGGSPHLCERHTLVLPKLAGYLQASKHEVLQPHPIPSTG